MSKILRRTQVNKLFFFLKKKEYLVGFKIRGMYQLNKLFSQYKQITQKHLIISFSFGFIVLLLIGYEAYFLNSKNDKLALLKTHEEKVFENYKSKVFGIDVSHYQGNIEWERVGEFENGVKISFVIMRAAVGQDEEDRQFATNWLRAKERGIIRGAYHYYRPDENSIKQADNFISIVKLEKGDLPPVLDIEAIPNVQSVKSLKKGLKKWLNKVEKHFGIKPIIYTADSYYKDFLNDTEFRAYTFWIANFNKIKQPVHKKWKIWQFTETGKVEGINHPVDFNVFKGSIAELRKMTMK